MGDTFENEAVDNKSTRIAGMDFHKGMMNFSASYSVPNKVDSMLKNSTSYNSIQIARRGKFAITGETITTTDIPHSTVAADWEERNDKAVTSTRDKISVNFDIAADFDLLGKVISDLQKDTGVSADNILGDLKYVEGYTGFSGDPEEQEGNYLAFKVDFTGTYTSLTVEASGEEKTLDNDKIMVLRIVKKAPIIVRAYNGTTCVASKEYRLDQLKCAAKA